MNWTYSSVISDHNTTTTTTTTPTWMSTDFDFFNLTNVTDAITNLTEDLQCQLLKNSGFVRSTSRYSAATRTAVAFAFIIIMVINVIGNSVVIIAVIIDRPLRQITSGLIISLAAADILVALSAEIHSIVLILDNGNLHVSQFLCELSTSADLYFSLCELLHLACLATERCLAICHPFQYERISRVFLWSIIVLSWTFPLAFSFVPIVGFRQIVGEPDLYECLKSHHLCVFIPSQFFSMLLFAVMFALPTSIMFYCYARIFLVAYSQRKRMNSVSLGTFSRSHHSSIDKIDKSINISSKELIPMTFPKVRDDDVEQEEANFAGKCTKKEDSNHIALTTSHSSASIKNDRFPLEAAKDLIKKASEMVQKSRQSTQNGRRNDDFKAARSIGLLCLFFLITWTPYWTTVLLLPFIGYQNIAGVVVASSLWLNFLGTALNPFIYYFSNSAVKEGILRVFRKLLNHLSKLVSTFLPHKR